MVSLFPFEKAYLAVWGFVLPFEEAKARLMMLEKPSFILHTPGAGICVAEQ